MTDHKVSTSPDLLTAFLAGWSLMDSMLDASLTLVGGKLFFFIFSNSRSTAALDPHP